MTRQTFAMIAAAGLSVVCTGAVYAVPVTGTLNFTGDATVTATTVDFLPPGVGTGNGAITSPASQSGTFSPLAATTVVVKDINTAVTPVGGAISIPSFVTFVAAPDIRFDLNLLSPGVFGTANLASPPAVGQTASPAGSMYNLVNLPGANGIQSNLSFAVSGNAVRISTGETTPVSGSFSMQFGTSYQSLLAAWSGGGASTTSFSATFTAVPEPASLAVLGVGGLLLVRRRSRVG